MWLEIDYKLKSGNDDRNLVIRLNYVMNEQKGSTTDNGDYTICMNLTPQVEMTEELLMAAKQRAQTAFNLCCDFATQGSDALIYN